LAAGGSRGCQSRLLPVVICHAAGVVLAQPLAVVAEDGKAEELVHVRQLASGMLSAGVAAGSAHRKGCAFG
jgi:hypothetical protein